MAWAEIASLAGLTKEDHFFDLGCGRGRVCFWTAHWIGCRVTGVDFVPAFIRKARQLQTGSEFLCAKLTDLSLHEATVIYLYTFHPDEEAVDFSFLRPHTRVITVSEPLNQSGFVVKNSMKAHFPWGEADVYINSKV
jgi:SAM-dependent methyltransferase